MEARREATALKPWTPAPAVKPLPQDAFTELLNKTLYDSPVMKAIEKNVSEPPQLAAGRAAHNNEEVRPGEKPEVPTPSRTGRMDRYNEDAAHIREIKPDNPRAEKAGEKQLARYKDEMEKSTGRPHTTELTKYKAKPVPKDTQP